METNEMLVKQYQDGDNTALEKIVENNKRLVYMVARKYYVEKTNSIDIEDLIQEGFIGLMRAAKKYNFDIENKATFASYAFLWIKQKINRFIQTRNTNSEWSLDKPLFKDGEDTLNDILAYDGESEIIENIERSELKEKIKETIDTTLSFTEKQVVECRYGFNGQQYTLAEVGSALNFSPERARQVEVRSLRKLRHSPFIIQYRREYFIDKACKKKEELNKHNVEASAIYFEELKKKFEELYKNLSTKAKCG